MAQRNILKKKIISLLLVFATLVGILAPISFSPSDTEFQTQYAYAQDEEGGGFLSCSNFLFRWGGLCLVKNFVFSKAGKWAIENIGTGIVAAVGLLFVTLGAAILGLAGLALNQAIDVTILKMSSIIGSLTVINTAWTPIRDAANILFIFIILYIAIGTILQLQKYNMRSLLVRVIIAALLINFSLFFTKVVIDASNLLAYNFYQPIASLDVKSEQGEGEAEVNLTGLSGAFMDQMKITGAYSIGGRGFTGAVNMFMTGIFYLILAFIFFAVTAFLLIRFVVLIMLMITSPIAFIGSLLPALGEQSKKWWTTLTNQAIWVPAFMLLITISYLLVADESFKAVSSDSEGALIVVFNFFVVIGFIMSALLISKQLGATGAPKIVQKAAGMLTFGAAAVAGRQTLGRAGRRIAQSDRVKKLAGSDNIFARNLGTGLRLGGERVGKASFDARATAAGRDLGLGEAARGGVAAGIERREKRREKYKKEGAEATKNIEEKGAKKEEKKEYEQKRAKLTQELDDARKEKEEYVLWRKTGGREGRKPPRDNSTSEARGKELRLESELDELDKTHAGKAEDYERKVAEVLSRAAQKLKPEETRTLRAQADKLDDLENINARERTPEQEQFIAELRRGFDQLHTDQQKYVDAHRTHKEARQTVKDVNDSRLRHIAEKLDHGDGLDHETAKLIRNNLGKSPEQKQVEALLDQLKLNVAPKSNAGSDENKKEKE